MSPAPLTAYQRRLVSENRALAIRLAMIAWSKNRQQDGDELVSVAYQGLVTAALLFDPTRTDIDPDDLENGKAFSGYARQRIVGSLLDWQRKSDFVPRRVRKAYKDLQAIGHGDGASTRDLAATTGLPESHIRTVVAAVETMPVSLDDRPETDDEKSSFGANEYYVAAEADVETDAAVALILTEMARTWAALPFLQRAAVANKFYFGKSVSRAAADLGCSTNDLRDALTAGIDAMLLSLRSTAAVK
jgi:DNA-directed RNA polymerase specialized sigma subunit